MDTLHKRRITLGAFALAIICVSLAVGMKVGSGSGTGSGGPESIGPTAASAAVPQKRGAFAVEGPRTEYAGRSAHDRRLPRYLDSGIRPARRRPGPDRRSHPVRRQHPVEACRALADLAAPEAEAPQGSAALPAAGHDRSGRRPGQAPHRGAECIGRRDGPPRRRLFKESGPTDRSQPGQCGHQRQPCPGARRRSPGRQHRVDRPRLRQHGEGRNPHRDSFRQSPAGQRRSRHRKAFPRPRFGPPEHRRRGSEDPALESGPSQGRRSRLPAVHQGWRRAGHGRHGDLPGLQPQAGRLRKKDRHRRASTPTRLPRRDHHRCTRHSRRPSLRWTEKDHPRRRQRRNGPDALLRRSQRSRRPGLDGRPGPRRQAQPPAFSASVDRILRLRNRLAR